MADIDAEKLTKKIDLLLETKGADKAASDLSKIQNATAGLQKSFNLLGNAISTVMDFAEVNVSIKKSTDLAKSYNDSISKLSTSFRKYGTDVFQVESQINKLSKSLGLNKSVMVDLIKQYEKGFNSPNLKGAETLFKNIQDIVGSDVDAIKEMADNVADLASKFPDLEDSLKNVNDSNRERLQNQTKLLYISGELSKTEYKGLQEYLQGAAKKNSAQDAEQKRLQETTKKIEDMKRQFTDVGLVIGQQVLPLFNKLADIAKNNPWMVKAAFASAAAGAIANTVSKVIPIAKNVSGMLGVGGSLFGSRGSTPANPIFTKSVDWMGDATKYVKSGASLLGGTAATVAGSAGSAYLTKLGWNYLVGEKKTDKSTLYSLGRTGSAVGAAAAAGTGIGSFFGGIGAVPGAIIGTGVGLATDAVHGFSRVQNTYESAQEVNKHTKELENEYKNKIKNNPQLLRAANLRSEGRNIAQKGTGLFSFAASDIETKQMKEKYAEAQRIEQAERKVLEVEEKKQEYASKLVQNTEINKKNIEETSKLLDNQLKSTSLIFKTQEAKGKFDEKGLNTLKASQKASQDTLNQNLQLLDKQLENYKASAENELKLKGTSGDRTATEAAIAKYAEEVNNQKRELVLKNVEIITQNLEINKADEERLQNNVDLLKVRQQMYASGGDSQQALQIQSQITSLVEKEKDDVKSRIKYTEDQMQVQRQIINDSHSSQAQKEAAEMTILELVKKQNDFSRSILEYNKQNTQTIIESTHSNQSIVDLQNSKLSYMETEMSLMSSIGVGLSASIEQRTKVVEQMEEINSSLNEQLSANEKALAQARQFAQVSSGDDKISALARVRALEQDRLEISNKILQTKVKEAEMTKALRDGYIGAIQAMTAGSGLFTKIAISQTKNLGIAVQSLGAVASLSSGGTGGGATSSGRYSVNGGIDEDPNRMAHMYNTYNNAGKYLNDISSGNAMLRNSLGRTSGFAAAAGANPNQLSAGIASGDIGNIMNKQSNTQEGMLDALISIRDILNNRSSSPILGNSALLTSRNR